MASAGGDAEKDAGAFDDAVGCAAGSRNVRRLFAPKKLHNLPANQQLAVRRQADLPGKGAVRRVVLGEVEQVGRVKKRVVDCHNAQLRLPSGCPKHQPAYASKPAKQLAAAALPVDADVDCLLHFWLFGF